MTFISTNNHCVQIRSFFSDDLKLADVTPIFKKKDSLNKENYRPVSILPYLLKVFERIIYKEIDSFMESKFSSYLCGFRKKSQCAILVSGNDQKLEKNN